MLTGLDHGAKLVTLPRFESESFLKSVHQHRPTMLQLVPPLVSYLSARPDLKLDSFHRLHTIIIGAAPLGPLVANKLIGRLGKPDLLMQEGYGMTETSSVTHLSPIVNNQIGSFGEPLSRTQVKVVDVDTGESLGPGQHGEMCVRGPQVMKGYYKNEKATKETIDSDGWLHTGDMVYYNEQNQFFIVDRLKELIKVKGFQVSPSELEDVLRRIPGVSDVAVIGVPDEIAGELPRAYVVKKKGITVTKEEIVEFVDVKVAPHKKLMGGVVFLDAIPKTNTGKLLRRELKNITNSLSQG
jgi:acyl-CoA synthetase (AMP-forming)/AMP-acid ligase II